MYYRDPTESTPFQMVKEFHEKFNVAIDVPTNNDLLELRGKLIHEETKETLYELANWTEDYGCLYRPHTVDKKKLTKELADLMYVTIGTAVTFGLPLEEVFAEVHKSNMSKLGDDGKPIYRADGKVLKGNNYKEPDLDQFFKE